MQNMPKLTIAQVLSRIIVVVGAQGIEVSPSAQEDRTAVWAVWTDFAADVMHQCTALILHMGVVCSTETEDTGIWVQHRQTCARQSTL